MPLVVGNNLDNSDNLNNLNNFHNYANNIMNNSIPESQIFNGYTTFLMCNYNHNNHNSQNNHHTANDDIRNHRMNWIITNYIKYDCKDDIKKDFKDIRDTFKDYYDTNISDRYTGNFNPPQCFYNYLLKMDDMEREKYLKECEERYNDDIEIHYRDIANRYDRSNQIDNIVLSDDENEDFIDSEEYDTEIMTQSDIIDEYYEYDDFDNNYDDFYEETEIEDDYNDW